MTDLPSRLIDAAREFMEFRQARCPEYHAALTLNREIRELLGEPVLIERGDKGTVGHFVTDKTPAHVVSALDQEHSPRLYKDYLTPVSIPNLTWVGL